ncbi:LOW QUALITY PROTEIN: histone H1.10 [Erythrolamprus reginae]|uniref:LOW QUALITY PROTEIN: histone H1.10 n=1 Tax=Erythrolamprus reginae TaxID=121349 RepID=UPI00396CE9F0
MSVELEEADLPATEAEEAPLAPEKRGAAKKAKGGVSALSPSKKKKNSKKKNQPGKYSQLVVESIRKLGERNGSSLAKIYNEAKKVAWFDQQNGRTYLKYSIKALVQNDTLLQVKGTGANGSFKLNRKKLEGEGGAGGGGGGAGGGSQAKSHHKKPAVVASTSRKVEKKPVAKSKKLEKKSHKKGAGGGGGGGAAKKDKVKAKKTPKKSVASPSAKKVKKSAKPKALKSRK